MDKFEADFKNLRNSVAKISSTKTPSELNALDMRIGATLRSLQFGVLKMASDIKGQVDQKRRSF